MRGASPAATTGVVASGGDYTRNPSAWCRRGNHIVAGTVDVAGRRVGQYARTTPWSHFAAFAILTALPVSLVYFIFQRYLVSGLAIGGVKG